MTAKDDSTKDGVPNQPSDDREKKPADREEGAERKDDENEKKK